MSHARDDYDRIQGPAGLIPEAEPVFLLRGQDEFAAQVVEFWADLMAARQGDPALIVRAREHAKRMRQWPKKKVPDL